MKNEIGLLCDNFHYINFTSLKTYYYIGLWLIPNCRHRSFLLFWKLW